MPSKIIEQYRKTLISSGNNLTKAREQVFKALATPEPISMSQLIKKLEGKVDRVSVYRNIELFEKIGLVHRVTIGWKYKLELSDHFLEHHHHLNCLSCGKSVDIEDEVHLNDFIKKISTSHGFQPERHQFEIDGYCSECLLKQEK